MNAAEQLPRIDIQLHQPYPDSDSWLATRKGGWHTATRRFRAIT